MKFPGKRKKKHYFPVSEKGRINFDESEGAPDGVYVLGIDQLLVDIEAEVSDEFLEEKGLAKGQSQVINDELCEEIYKEVKDMNVICGEYAGGAIGNTLHNYSVLSDNRAIALGCITKNITIGDYAFKYVSTTNSHVDLSYLQPVDAPMGRALCFITPDKERTFAISKGCMDDLHPNYVNEDIVKNSAVLLLSAFLFRDESTPMFQSCMKAVEFAKKHFVPVVLSMGTSALVEDRRKFFLEFIRDYVTVLAMNEREAFSLTNELDVLKATQKSLELCDMSLVTAGEHGLYMGAYVDKCQARETQEPLISKSIPEYNFYEYSRAMRREFCFDPIQAFTHINPYMGGPRTIKNTNGAGDAALAAVLHDMAANRFHRNMVPQSSKHYGEYLTYSSISQISKYSNRVSFEVLVKNSPRLTRGLPEKEDSLEEAYWER